MSEFLIWLGNIMVIMGVILLVGLVVVWYVLKRINAQLEQKLVEAIQQVEDRVVHLTIDLDNNVYYCYNKQDNSFVCQGTTAKEIRDAFQSRFPQKVAVLDEEDQVKFADLVADILELKKNETSNSQ